MYERNCREEGVWRFPLLPSANAPTFDSLRTQPPPLPEKILNVYDIQTKPELTRYYHAATGFPMKPTWFAAIRNATTRRDQAWTGRWRRNTFPKQRRCDEGTDAGLSPASAQQSSRSWKRRLTHPRQRVSGRCCCRPTISSTSLTCACTRTKRDVFPTPHLKEINT